MRALSLIVLLIGDDLLNLIVLFTVIKFFFQIQWFLDTLNFFRWIVFNSVAIFSPYLSSIEVDLLIFDMNSLLHSLRNFSFLLHSLL